jgi:hypothetical protein
MPEGPAERGVEATQARARAGACHAESIDGAEHSGSIEPVMAERHAAAYRFAVTSHSSQGRTARVAAATGSERRRRFPGKRAQPIISRQPIRTTWCSTTRAFPRLS